MKAKKTNFDQYVEGMVKKNPSLKAELEKASQAWDIAFQVRDVRERAGLTQKQLAELVGTKQSNIAKVESADYTSYTLQTLEKITKALKAKLEIKIVPQSSQIFAHS